MNNVEIKTPILLVRLQLDIKDSEYEEVQRKTKLVDALKELYSSGQVAAASPYREDSDPPNSREDCEEQHQPTLVMIQTLNHERFTCIS